MKAFESYCLTDIHTDRQTDGCPRSCTAPKERADLVMKLWNMGNTTWAYQSTTGGRPMCSAGGLSTYHMTKPHWWSLLSLNYHSVCQSVADGRISVVLIFIVGASLRCAVSELASSRWAVMVGWGRAAVGDWSPCPAEQLEVCLSFARLQWWANSNCDSIQSRFESRGRFDSNIMLFRSGSVRFDTDSFSWFGLCETHFFIYTNF